MKNNVNVVKRETSSILWFQSHFHFISVNSYFPISTCLTFGQLPKLDALKSKLNEFNGKVPGDAKMSENHLARLYDLINAGEN